MTGKIGHLLPIHRMSFLQEEVGGDIFPPQKDLEEIMNGMKTSNSNIETIFSFTGDKSYLKD